MKSFQLFVIILICFNSISQNNTKCFTNRNGYYTIYGIDRPDLNYPDSAKIEEGLYVNDRREGIWVKYFEDGKTVRFAGTYKNNRPHGNYSQYYRNGKIKEKGNYFLGKYSDSLIRFYENGIKSYEAFYDSLGHENGQVYYYYSNGRLALKLNFASGQLNDKSTSYLPDGTILSKINSDDSMRIYLTIHLGMSDQLKPSQLTDTIDFHPNGIPWNPNNFNILYDEENNMVYNGFFRNEILWDGRKYIYNLDGILTKIEMYKLGFYHSETYLPLN